MKPNKALLIVDMQNDFCPGGALGVKQGDKIIPKINRYIKLFSKNKLPIFVSRDWHPKKTAHFKKFGGVWPAHCVQKTKGAAFHPKLKLPKDPILLYKGMDPDKDSYSVFQAEDAFGNSFIQLLKKIGIQEIYIAGLATDYCVKYTAMDAINKGFKIKILVDAVKGVNLKPNDSKEALDFLTRVGAKKLTLETTGG